ncbi:type II toxin-antitoxin system VapC family toxin [Asanoa sp. NPDC050611]|uniref:type II toxin-antitoxin system VapC family toxin n=1 Tax=Asanoa sp. NPDC050611 TaxID=3157098 RepID=UPI00340700F4
MTGPVVIDASAAVALLADGGHAGDWVAATVAGARLAAPELMPFEAANILRRHLLAGLLDATAAGLAHADLVDLPVDLYPYRGLDERVWDLHGNLTVYDAGYVALAELLSAPLVTLDGRIGRAAGPKCPIVTYPSATATA